MANILDLLADGDGDAIDESDYDYEDDLGVREREQEMKEEDYVAAGFRELRQRLRERRGNLLGVEGFAFLRQCLGEASDLLSECSGFSGHPPSTSRVYFGGPRSDDEWDVEKEEEEKEESLGEGGGAWKERLALLQEVDESWSEIGDITWQVELAVEACHILDDDIRWMLFRFFTLPHILHAVWADVGNAFQDGFIRVLANGFDPVYHRMELRHADAMRAYLDSITFVLDDPRSLEVAHALCAIGTSPEMLLWLKRNGRFNPSLLPRDVIVSVRNRKCLELLVGETGIDFNMVVQRESISLLGGLTDVCAVENATSAEYVCLLLKGGFKLETLTKTKLKWPATLRYILEAAAGAVKTTFSMSELLGLLEMKEPFSLNDASQSADFVAILHEFKFEPDVEELKRGLIENKWKEDPCGAIGGSLVSFGFLKMTDLPPCCLKRVELRWRPWPGVHCRFSPTLQSEVVMTLLVFKRLVPTMPKDLRNKILIMAFGQNVNNNNHRLVCVGFDKRLKRDAKGVSARLRRELLFK